VPKAMGNDERVTCSSCRFTYARSREFCPLCGTVQPPDIVCRSQTASAAPQSPSPTALTGLREMLSLILNNPVRAFASIIILSCAIYVFLGKPQKSTSRATAPDIKKMVVESVPQVVPVQPSSDQGQIVTNASIRSQLGAVSPPKAEITHDPVELWKEVQHGSTDAEVELAIMYLDGRRVTQNCEQAHLLLLAAAKKQSARSRNLLSGIYAERCR